MPGASSARRLIINADDFGRDESCTRAIAERLASGIITSTSIMANGRCFEMACELTETMNLHGRVGVHLSLDEGPPLSAAMASFADANGQLCVRRTLKPLGRELAGAIEAELAAQIERVQRAGIRPTHIDSHRHIHTAFPIARVVVRLARRYGIRRVRLARNLACRPNMVARTYKTILNAYLAARVDTADHFADIVEFYQQPRDHAAVGLIECMTHLDESPRGLSERRLLDTDAFRQFVANYQLVAHAYTSN